MWNRRSGEGFEYRSGIVVGDGSGGDLRHVSRGRRSFAFRFCEVRRGGYAGSAGVSGILEEELHGSALHAGVGAVRAFGVFVATEVAVVKGVRVDDDASGTLFLGDVDFHATEVAAVAGENDFSFETDA